MRDDFKNFHNYDALEFDEVEPSLGKRVSPGKRSLTMGLPPRAASAGAPAQRRAKPKVTGNEAALQMKSASHTAAWMDVAIRPDLNDAPVQRKAGELSTEGLPSDGGGQPMPEAVQAKMESAFGTDFSGVRVHEGPRSEALGAVAYTQGNDIHFSPGAYQPNSQSGQELLGHELTHVVQQRQGRVSATTQAKGVDVNDDAGLEREADEMGAKAARGEPVNVANANAMTPASKGAVQQKSAPIQREQGSSTENSTENSTDPKVTAAQNTAFDFGLAITIYGPVKLEGKVAGSYSKKDGSDGGETEVEGMLYGGILVDLWLVKIRAGIEGKVKFNVKGQTDVLTAVKKGINEIAQWRIANDFVPKLTAAKQKLESKWPSTVTNFTRHHNKVMAEIRKGNFQDAADTWYFSKSPREWAEYYARCWNEAITESFDGLGAEVDKSRLLNTSMLSKKFNAIAGAKNKEAALKLAGDAHSFGVNEVMRTLNEAKKSLDSMQVVENDPNVGFEASIAFKAGASVQATGAASGEIEVARVISVGDKLGDKKWNTDSTAATVVSGKITIGDWEAGLVGDWKKDDVEIAVSLSKKNSTAPAEKAKHSVGSILNAVKGSGSVLQMAGSPLDTTKAIARQVGAMVKENSKELTDPKNVADRLKGSMALEQSIGVEVKLKFARADWKLSGGSVKVTLVSAKLSAEKHLGAAAKVGVTGSVSTGGSFEAAWGS